MSDVSTALQSFMTSGFGAKAWRPVFVETRCLARRVLHLRTFVGYFLVHVVMIHSSLMSLVPLHAWPVTADSTGVTDRVVNQMLCYLDGVCI